MPVRISRALLERILDEAEASPCHEICGLLLGQGAEVRDIRVSANVAQDPARRFEDDPAVLIAAHKAARQAGLRIMGHYHSHPNGGTEPSVCDAEMAVDDGSLWLICSPSREFRMWRTGAQGLHGRFAVCDIAVDA